jgi:hypothetical protein
VSATCPASTIARATSGRPIAPGLALRLDDERREVHGHAQRGKALADRFDAGDARGALPREEAAERRVVGLEEVGEHVHVAAGLDRGDLDAADRLDAARPRERPHLGHRRRGVVIGDGHDTQAGRSRAIDEGGRRQAAVGCGGMEVEIDHRAARAAEPWPGLRRVRP